MLLNNSCEFGAIPTLAQKDPGMSIESFCKPGARVFEHPPAGWCPAASLEADSPSDASSAARDYSFGFLTLALTGRLS